MAPTGGPGRSVTGWASVLRARGELAEAGRGVGRAELDQAGGDGPSAKGSEREKGWAGLGCCWVLGWGDGLSLVLGSFSNSSSLLFLIQTKFEFKYKFEFKPHSIN